MKKHFYLKHVWIIALLTGISITNLQAQVRSSTADYPNLVEFSGSQSNSEGLVYEVMPGPSVINPAMNPTPFSDSINISTGSYNLTVVDIDEFDSMNSQDSVQNVMILFTGNDGTEYKIDQINIIHKPDTVGDHTFFGGVGLNKKMHGSSMIGTGLMPSMMAYITLWGLTDLKNAATDEVIASNRVIHLMVATNVRDDSLRMDTNVVTDGSDYNIKNAHTHIILPPLDMQGNPSPVPGTDHGFLHMMFEKSILEDASEDWTKVYEVLPGPAVMNPAMNPTPFSDNLSIGAGTYSISVEDIDDADSMNSLDSVIAVDIQFERPGGQQFMIDHINIIHKPDGAGDHPFFGGVAYDLLMHGNTTIGTGLMPKMTAYITLWGITDLKDGDGNVIAANRIIHMMVATRVRRDDLTMIASGVIDSSDYSADMRETHIILPPLDMEGNMSPVPGTRHGFLHLMFENVSMDIVTAVNEISADELQVIAYPNPSKGLTTIEYQIEHNSDIQLTVYSANGALIETLVNEQQSPGNYRIEFNTDSNLPAGMYFYRINVNGNPTIGKISVIK